MLKLQITPKAIASIDRLAELTGESPESIINEHLTMAIDQMIEGDIKGEILDKPAVGLVNYRA